jgi:hypothetical protein
MRAMTTNIDIVRNHHDASAQVGAVVDLNVFVPIIGSLPLTQLMSDR